MFFNWLITESKIFHLTRKITRSLNRKNLFSFHILTLQRPCKPAARGFWSSFIHKSLTAFQNDPVVVSAFLTLARMWCILLFTSSEMFGLSVCYIESSDALKSFDRMKSHHTAAWCTLPVKCARRRYLNKPQIINIHLFCLTPHFM